MKIFALICTLLFPLCGVAQHATQGNALLCTPTDSAKVANLLQKAAKQQWQALPPGQIIGKLGESLLGTPYVAHTLEAGLKEPLVINLREVDCTTFLEYVTAMTLCIHQKQTDFGSFVQHLETLRYRNGQRQGYPSRLHYFSEWLSDNEQKGLIEIVTPQLGGIKISKKLDFMSQHRDSYALLKDEGTFRKVAEQEEAKGTTTFTYLPKDQIADKASYIQHGDLLALTTQLNGLDVVHVGFAYKKNGALHLLHAGTGSMQVEISAQPLAAYMETKKIQTGIMVARLRQNE